MNVICLGHFGTPQQQSWRRQQFGSDRDGRERTRAQTSMSQGTHLVCNFLQGSLIYEFEKLFSSLWYFRCGARNLNRSQNPYCSVIRDHPFCHSKVAFLTGSL